MKFRIISAFALACVCALACAGVAAAQDTGKGKAAAEVKVSGGERDAAQKITKASGTEAKLQAAAAFVKKYPQSSLRQQIAQDIAKLIIDTQDAQAKASLAQAYLDIFNRPEEAAYVNASLLNAYINAGKTEEAMKMGASWLQQHPDDIQTMQNLTILASAAAIKNNNAFIAQGRQYGAKAIEMLEADKMPEGTDAAKWAQFKAAALVSLYRETGVLAFKSNDNAAALPLLQKAASLKSPDPGVYLLLSDLTNDQYEQLAKEYQVAPAAEKAEKFKKVQTSLDQVIDAYAQAVAITEGVAQYQPVNASLKQALEQYYKYRHNSTQGMQQLIDKYKKPAQ
ncbi:MAG: hypothetical protein QOC99_149 [Acidobacteriota bacterium]|jgi:hypothetical protein|nr:hypothetical protein [Acidobacteriota bacterium]